MSYMLIQTVIKRKTTQTTSDYEWLWVTTNDSEWLEKVLHTFIKVHLPVLKELQLPFTTGVKKKLEATVLVMNNTNQLPLSLAKNRWMKLDESLPSTTKVVGAWQGTLAYTCAQLTIWGVQNLRCTIVYVNMLLGAPKNVYQDF